MRIKSWESPRRRGRNDKGQGGSARQRQLKKRDKMLRNKLKRDAKLDQQFNQDSNGGEMIPLFFMAATRRLGDNLQGDRLL